MTEEQSIPTGRFKPLVGLLRYKWLALLIFIVVNSIGVPVALHLGEPPVFHSVKVVLLVSPKFIPNLVSERGMDLGRTEYQFYVKQQINLITRHDVLQEALQSPEVRKNWLLPGEPIGRAKGRLKRSISTKSKRSDPFITVKLSSSKYKGLDIVLNGLINTYLKKSQSENIYDSDGRIKRLQQRRDKLELLLSTQLKQRTKIAEKLGVTTFQENTLGPYDSIIVETTSALTQARRQRVEAEIRLATLKDKQGNGKTTLDIFVNEMVANDGTLKSFKAALINRRTDLLTQTLGLTPKHPSKKRAQREMAKIDRDIEQATQVLFEEIRTRLLEKHKAEIYQARRFEQTLAKELKGQHEQANQYVSQYHEALELNKEISRAYQELEKINSRIDYLTIESTAPGFVRLDTPAKPLPNPAESKRLILILIIVVIVALALAIGVSVLIDLLDQHIHTPGEVHKILGFSPMAWILERHNLSTEEFAMDHLRRLALTLERERHNNKTTAFVLTSVKPDGGTTTLTLELAQILSEIGVRTLAMELNAFKPDERYEGISPYNSLTTLLDQYTPLNSPEMFVIPATEDLPDRLPVGETEKRYLSTYGRLRSIIEQFNAHYDLILLDTPPLLLSADAELLGKVAGGVLLVIEAGAVTPGELKRAAQLLERLNPPVVGSILNRVRVFQGGGYFAKLLKEYERGTKLRRSWIKRLFLR